MINKIDLSILNIMNKIQNPVLDDIMVFFSFLGNDGFIWIFIIVTMLTFTHSRKYGFLLLLELPVAMLIANKLLKNFVDRPRPFHTYPELRLLVEPSGTHSFPSSHATVAFTVLGFFIFFKLRYRKTVAIIASGIGISRIYLNVHYFFDVFVGILLGFSIAYLFSCIYKKFNFCRIVSRNSS